MTENRIGKPGSRGNRVQVTRITGNQHTLEMVRAFAPYPHTKRFQTRIYTDLHGFSGFIVLIRAIRGCKSQEKGSTILTGLCKTKPICQRDKTEIKPVLTKDYEEKARPVSESKQSQTKPI